MRFGRLTAIAVVLVSSLAIGCRSSSKHLAEAAERGDVVYKQYKDSDYPTAKASLLEHISFLDALARSDPELANTCTADAMISYVRLAKLEEKNQGSEKDRYMAEAVTRCGKLTIKVGNCSAEALRSDVDRRDRLPPK